MLLQQNIWGAGGWETFGWLEFRIKKKELKIGQDVETFTQQNSPSIRLPSR